MRELKSFQLSEYEEERYGLALGRIREIAEGEAVSVVFSEFFQSEAKYLVELEGLRNVLATGKWDNMDLELLEARNQKLYGMLLPEAYPFCYGNPDFATEKFGEAGVYLSLLWNELRGCIPFAFEQRRRDMLIAFELFLVCFGVYESEEAPVKALKDTLYWYVMDYTPIQTEYRIREQLDPSLDFARNIIMNSDLSDPRYLYEFGEYISENEIKTAEFLAGLSQKEIDSIAKTWTEGYRIGFEVQRKDLSKKKTVNIRYQLGFERVVRAAILQFREIGLESVIYRPTPYISQKRSQLRTGYVGTSPNPQFESDHKNDAALFMNADFVSMKLSTLRQAYEAFEELASVHGGPAVMEVFGEAPFSPAVCASAMTLSSEQQQLVSGYYTEATRITNRYIKGEERSFTIIAYPIPEIGENFAEIFAETIKINNLDYHKYQEIQQKLIDALDQGEKVEIKGAKGNETDLTVMLHPLTDPEGQTNFENCVADVNIPVGEVFTSPILTGTRGTLHVSQVYLGDYGYKDLKIRVEDGMIADYSCANFAEESENRKFIEENILFHHATIPMGEFAIGTNTTAFAVARKYGIASKLPILIAEKMGPHFAFGDTCYSFQEDLAVFNPDGKEIIARDNERSLLRKSDPSKAYFGCHTDITLPYPELGSIDVICKDGRSIRLLENGRFVLPGTEELNLPLDEMD